MNKILVCQVPILSILVRRVILPIAVRNGCFCGGWLSTTGTSLAWISYIVHWTTLDHTGPHCTTLHHCSPHCHTLHQTETNCNALHQTAPACTTLHHTAPHCTFLLYTVIDCNTLRYPAQHYITLHYTKLYFAAFHQTKLQSRTLPSVHHTTHLSWTSSSSLISWPVSLPSHGWMWLTAE